MEMGYLTVSQVRLGAKIGDARAKDSNAFRKRLIKSYMSRGLGHLTLFPLKILHQCPSSCGVSLVLLAADATSIVSRTYGRESLQSI